MGRLPTHATLIRLALRPGASRTHACIACTAILRAVCVSLWAFIRAPLESVLSSLAEKCMCSAISSTAVPIMFSVAISGVILCPKPGVGLRSKRFHLCPQQDTVQHGSPVHRAVLDRERQPSDGSHSTLVVLLSVVARLRFQLCPGAPDLINEAGVPPSFIGQSAFPGKFRRRPSHDPDCASIFNLFSFFWNDSIRVISLQYLLALGEMDESDQTSSVTLAGLISPIWPVFK
jgi:hypothetical protein